MQHDLDRIILSVVLISLAPVVAHSICEYRSILVERRGGDATADIGISF